MNQAGSYIGAEVLGSIILALIIIPPLWRIFRRAGYSGLWSLFVVLPVLGLVIVTCILAFAPWPNVRREV